jgi:8-oxo-dGTP diphosphatase
MNDSREYPARPIVGVGAVVQKDDCVLLIQRGKEPGRGIWSLPGGTVELGERLPAAAAREVFEECGVVVQVQTPLETFDLILRDDSGRPKYHYVIIDFVARYISGEASAASDAADARWVRLADLANYELNEKTLEVIYKAVDIGRH